MDEYITPEERDKVLRERPRVGQSTKNSNWKGRMERLQAGDTIVLYPNDDNNARDLAQTARSYGWKLGIKLRIHKIPGEQLKLYIWMV